LTSDRWPLGPETLRFYRCTPRRGAEKIGLRDNFDGMPNIHDRNVALSNKRRERPIEPSELKSTTMTVSMSRERSAVGYEPSAIALAISHQPFTVVRPLLRADDCSRLLMAGLTR
jgi:hypothetical protein